MVNENAYEVISIDSRSWRIEDKTVRAYLLAGEDRALLVDSGYGTGNIREVVEGLTDLPVVLANTHADRDHVGCNHLFEYAAMHPAEYDRYHQAAGGTRAVRPLWEGDAIALGGRSFEVILIPGHTPGSIALLDAQNGVLLSGDSVQAGLIYMFGPGRNLDAYITSLEKLRAMRGRFDTVYPSHGVFPVKADILDGLIDGAKRMQSGKIEPADAPFDTAAKVYDAGVARFLYSPLNS